MNGEQKAVINKADAGGLRVDKNTVIQRIAKIDYHHFPGTCHTVCCITMKNGHTIVGDSACVDAKNFSLATGKHWAYESAVGKACDKESYLLSQRLFTFGE